MMYWVVVVVLFLAAAWSFDIATYNWFAADFPSEYKHAYLWRGNIFLFVAVALFAASISLIVALLRVRKRRQIASAGH